MQAVGIRRIVVERNCMLKLKYMFENFELAKFALENWEHDEKGLDEYLKYFRISSNAVYPFAIQGKRCFLRLAPVEEKKARNLLGELEFLEYLRKDGYPAMRPVLSKNGSTLLKLDTKWGQYYASVFEGVPGKCIEDTDYSAEIMISYGKALGKLHRLSMEYEPIHEKWSYEAVLGWIREVLTEYSTPEEMMQEWEAVKKELEVLERNLENYGLVHYDFEPDNVFYDENTGACHVIDFEDGMYHFFLVDVEQVLDALSEELEGDAFLQAKAYFLQGYRSEKTLELDFEEKLSLMRRFCNLYSYARLTHCLSEEVSEAPEWMVKLRGMLEKKRVFLERGVAGEV